MQLNLNKALNTNLRDVINKYIEFTLKISHNTSVPKRKNDKRTRQVKTDSYLCICAALDRIDDLVDYCNSLNIKRTKEGVFDFCNLLTHAQTLIDCISQIGKIFNIRYETEKDTSSFHNLGESGDGNDEEYFKYIRSLCSVHPLNTNSHGIYQGSNPEWCPYVGFLGKANPLLFNKESNDADFYALIYKYEDDGIKILSTHTKTIYLRTKEVFHYIEKRYNFIEQVTNDAVKYYEEKIEELRNKHIKTPEEFNNYFDYLLELQNAVLERCGDDKRSIVRKWIAIFKTKFEVPYLQTVLEEYQKAVKEEIKKIHQRLQDLVFEDDEINLELFWDLKHPSGYHYQLEKISYLYPAYALEVEKENNFDFIETEPEVYIIKMKKMLSVLDEGVNQKLSIESLMEIARELNHRYEINNYEWARLQLKILEPALKNGFKFDYFTNEWKLYLQFKMGLWMYNKDNKI